MRAIALCVLVTAVGCHDALVPAVPQAASMSAVSATTQDAVAGEAVGQPPTVIARDASGRPVAGVPVAFYDSSASAAFSATTQVDGTASVVWVAGTHVGHDRMTALAQGTASVQFFADVHAGAPRRLLSDVLLDQAGAPDEPLATEPSVRLVDKYDNAIAGVSVTFTVTGPAASTIQHATVVTDADGRAVAGAWKLGSEIGRYTLTAAVPAAPVSSLVFTARINTPFTASSLAAGATATCAIASSSGETYCWGHYRGNFLPTPTPELVWGTPPLATLVVGSGHACGLTSTGTAYCWGANESGQLGLGTVSDVEPQPRAVVGDMSFMALVAGDAFTCGLTATQLLYCWGDNTVGQLGIGTLGGGAIPAAVLRTDRFSTIAAGARHACATATSGTTYCWGANDTGQLGAPAGDVCQTVSYSYYYGPYTIDINCSRIPVVLRDAPGVFLALTASGGTCGLLDTRQAYCWGYGRNGIPNDGRFVSLAAGGYGVCGITTTRAISCWSYLAGSAPPSTLTTIAGVAEATAIVGGRSHWCAVGTGAQTAFCWGANADGQLGNGTHASTTRPLPVAAP